MCYRRLSSGTARDNRFTEDTALRKFPPICEAEAEEYSAAKCLGYSAELDCESDGKYLRRSLDYHCKRDRDPRAIRKAHTFECKSSAMICGSSFKNQGVQTLLDAVCAYLPSPDDRCLCVEVVTFQ